MNNGKVYGSLAAVAAIVVIVLAFVAFQPMAGQTTTSGSSNSTDTGSTSLQAGNHTYVATFISTMESAPSSTTTTATTSTGSATSTSASTTTSTQATVTGNSYSYTSSSQVKILAVSATVSGDTTVGFSVQFQNIGSNTIYVLGGGGSGLTANVVSGSADVMKVSSPRCMIAEAMLPVDSGATHTSVAPGCWSGYYFQLVQGGTVNVEMTLTWSGGTNTTGSGSVQVEATFSLS